MLWFNRPFSTCFEPHYESEAKCKVFVMKISFHSYANKTNFRMKSFALSLTFIVRFTATQKWPILFLVELLLCFVFVYSHVRTINKCKSNESTADRFAQLVEYQTTVREVAGSNPGRTNTQGL